MDGPIGGSSTAMAMAMAIIVGLMGAAFFIISGSGPTKTKSKKEGLKPRGMQRTPRAPKGVSQGIRHFLRSLSLLC